jgi:hypothetical protein
MEIENSSLRKSLAKAKNEENEMNENMQVLLSEHERSCQEIKSWKKNYDDLFDEHKKLKYLEGGIIIFIILSC